jgi:hypothetical protein
VPWFDVGVVVRFAGDFGAGVSYSRLSDRSRASVAAAIPHPFYFNQPREVAGTIDGVRHKEAATHVNLVYVFARPRFDVALGGGASFFSVEQQLVSDIVYAESYPYDTAEFVDGVLAADTVSKTGYNVSVDVVYKVSDTWGVGGLLRFSRARVPFQVNNVDAGRVNVGGLQAGGGLRVMF